ncbi:hypothetical protein RB653_003534 [Dictyostelium firmibasis]|uniref:Uncharacterized protein n=1 Tax=Dictyostelium firmibasis TaxID=79012 RepID=A0AAN7U874_9MYCE
MTKKNFKDEEENESLLEAYNSNSNINSSNNKQSISTTNRSDQKYGINNANKQFSLNNKKSINGEDIDEEELVQDTLFFKFKLDNKQRNSIRLFVQIVSLVILAGYLISINALYFSTSARSIIFYPPINTDSGSVSPTPTPNHITLLQTSTESTVTTSSYDSSEIEALNGGTFNMKYFFYFSTFDILLLSYFISLFWLLLIFSDNYIYHVVSYIMTIVALIYNVIKSYFTITQILSINKDIITTTSNEIYMGSDSYIPETSPLLNSLKVREMIIVIVLVGIPLMVLFLMLHLITLQLSYKKHKRLSEKEKQFYNQAAEEKRLNKKVEVKHSNLKRLIQLSRPELPIILAAMVALVFSSLTSLAMPYFFGSIVQVVATTHSFNNLNSSTLGLVIIFVVGSVATLVRSWLFYLAGQKFVARIRRNLFSSIIQQEIGYFDQCRTGELLSRLSSDSQVIQNSVTVNISMLFRYSIQIIGSIILLFITNWRLTLLMLGIVPVLAISTVFYGKKIKQLGKQFQDELAKSSTTGEEVISNIRTVRSFSKEQKFIDLYSKDINGSFLIGKSLAVATGVFSGIVFLVAQLAIVLIVYVGARQVLDGTLSTGDLTSFLLYTLSLAMSLAFISSLMTDFLKAIGSSDRIFEIFDRVPAINVSGGKQIPNPLGEIELKDIEFSYPTRPNNNVLKGLNLKLKKGTITALVGPSGGGKSTVIAMIERFYDPNSGSITFDGVDIKELDPVWYRGIIGYVSQEPVLFAGSIKDNITFGNDSASMDEIISAAEKANAHSFIEEFENGYDTIVGERGVRLSGGQKQRIAIARAMIQNPMILLLDEATSALDAESEYLVKQAIDEIMKDRTVVVIAHRLSTVINANTVVVINQGKIEEMGTHKELLNNPDGTYHNLVKRQLSSDE